VSALHCVVWRIDADLDPIAIAGDDGVLWIHDDLWLAGRGVALEIAPSERSALSSAASDALAAIDVESHVDPPGAGPVAFGALPFDIAAPATLVVPSVLFGHERDGTRWLCWTGEGDAPAPEAVLRSYAPPAPGRAATAGPTSFTVTSPRPPLEWCDAVAAARDELRAGVARKVVLARDVVVACDADIARAPVLARLRDSYPTCFVFAMPSGAGRPTLLGASPELLVSRHGDVVRSQPMAGTSRRSPDPAVDARLAAGLLASHKDRVEHQITIDMAHDTLLPWCSYLDAETDPSVVGVANVHHLATAVVGRLSRPLPSVLDLVHALHPTPAVCGDPRDASADLIRRHEGIDRGAYAAPVGWVDRHGNGQFAVGVRSAEISGRHARLFAGVGVVADSEPEAELEETRVKLQAMLGALIRP
jgi:menaquinone-specific isochorismate synthase